MLLSKLLYQQSYEIKVVTNELEDIFNSFLQGDLKPIQKHAKKLDEITHIQSGLFVKTARSMYYSIGNPLFRIVGMSLGNGKSLEIENSETGYGTNKQAFKYTDSKTYKSLFITKHKATIDKVELVDINNEQMNWDTMEKSLVKSFKLKLSYLYESNNGKVSKLNKQLSKFWKRTYLKKTFCFKLPNNKTKIDYHKIKFVYEMGESFINRLIIDPASTLKSINDLSAELISENQKFLKAKLCKDIGPRSGGHKIQKKECKRRIQRQFTRKLKKLNNLLKNAQNRDNRSIVKLGRYIMDNRYHPSIYYQVRQWR